MRIQADIFNPKGGTPEITDLLADAKNEAIASIQHALPAMLASCPSIAQMDRNNQLAALYDLNTADLTKLHREVVDALTKSCRVRVLEQSGRVAIELTFKGEFVYRMLNVSDDTASVYSRVDPRNPRSDALRFLFDLSRGVGEIRLTAYAKVNAAKLELTLNGYSMESVRDQPWLSELAAMYGGLFTLVAEALGPLWTVEDGNEDPWSAEATPVLDGTEKTVAMRVEV